LFFVFSVDDIILMQSDTATKLSMKALSPCYLVFLFFNKKGFLRCIVLPHW